MNYTTFSALQYKEYRRAYRHGQQIQEFKVNGKPVYCDMEKQGKATQFNLMKKIRTDVTNSLYHRALGADTEVTDWDAASVMYRGSRHWGSNGDLLLDEECWNDGGYFFIKFGDLVERFDVTSGGVKYTEKNRSDGKAYRIYLGISTVGCDNADEIIDGIIDTFGDANTSRDGLVCKIPRPSNAAGYNPLSRYRWIQILITDSSDYLLVDIDNDHSLTPITNITDDFRLRLAGIYTDGLPCPDSDVLITSRHPNQRPHEHPDGMDAYWNYLEWSIHKPIIDTEFDEVISIEAVADQANSPPPNPWATQVAAYDMNSQSEYFSTDFIMPTQGMPYTIGMTNKNVAIINRFLYDFGVASDCPLVKSDPDLYSKDTVKATIALKKFLQNHDSDLFDELGLNPQNGDWNRELIAYFDLEPLHLVLPDKDLDYLISVIDTAPKETPFLDLRPYYDRPITFPNTETFSLNRHDSIKLKFREKWNVFAAIIAKENNINVDMRITRWSWSNGTLGPYNPDNDPQIGIFDQAKLDYYFRGGDLLCFGWEYLPISLKKALNEHNSIDTLTSKFIYIEPATAQHNPDQTGMVIELETSNFDEITFMKYDYLGPDGLGRSYTYSPPPGWSERSSVGDMAAYLERWLDDQSDFGLNFYGEAALELAVGFNLMVVWIFEFTLEGFLRAQGRVDLVTTGPNTSSLEFDLGFRAGAKAGLFGAGAQMLYSRFWRWTDGGAYGDLSLISRDILNKFIPEWTDWEYDFSSKEQQRKNQLVEVLNKGELKTESTGLKTHHWIEDSANTVGIQIKNWEMNWWWSDSCFAVRLSGKHDNNGKLKEAKIRLGLKIDLAELNRALEGITDSITKELGGTGSNNDIKLEDLVHEFGTEWIEDATGFSMKDLGYVVEDIQSATMINGVSVTSGEYWQQPSSPIWKTTVNESAKWEKLVQNPKSMKYLNKFKGSSSSKFADAEGFLDLGVSVSMVADTPTITVTEADIVSGNPLGNIDYTDFTAIANALSGASSGQYSLTVGPHICIGGSLVITIPIFSFAGCVLMLQGSVAGHLEAGMYLQWNSLTIPSSLQDLVSTGVAQSGGS